MKVQGTPLERQMNVAAEKKAEKPRICEVLGVEVGEWFTAGGDIRRCVTETGRVMFEGGSIVPGSALCDLINHPEWIKRCPRLTLAELAICKAVGAKWVTRDADEDAPVVLHRKKPFPESDGDYLAMGESWIADVDEGLFPSAKPGDCICVEEVSV